MKSHVAATPLLLKRLAVLRTELVDLAYDLDVRGSRAAADVAMTTSVRLGELCDEFYASLGPARSQPNVHELSETARLVR